MVNILIVPLDNSNNLQAKKLLEFYRYSDNSKYKITNDPIKADVILVCDVGFLNYGENILKNKFIKKFLNKCFILSITDRPIPVFRGILTSGEKSFINFGRIRTISYNGYSDNFKNPFISNYSFEDNPNIKKEYFFSFIGRDSDPVRKEIFNIKYKRKDIFLLDSTNTFNLYETNIDFLNKQKQYCDVMIRSKFVLCPRGWGATSFRLFEAMKLGLVPVIISDEWILPKGPKWEDFSIIISKKDIMHLEEKMLERENDFAEMGLLAKNAFDKYFEDNVIFEKIILDCLDIKKNQLIPESFFFYIISPIYIKLLKFKNGRFISMRNGFNLIFTRPFDMFKKSNLQKIKRFFS